MNSIVQFVGEVRSELAKVVWPGSREFVGSVVVVLLLICAFAIFLGAVDAGCFRLMHWIYGAVGVEQGL